MMLGVVVGSTASGQALSRTGRHYRIQGAVGLALIVLGLVLLSHAWASRPAMPCCFQHSMVGIGLGMTFPLYVIAVQNSAPGELVGTATSIVPFARSMGGSFGLAIFGSIMTNRFAAEF